MKQAANFYLIRQAFDRGSCAAREFIVRRKSNPLAMQPGNPEKAQYPEEHAAWTDGFEDVMRRFGGWK